ncbi:hypothetical protein CBR_g3334 [Chara braunii]|uniref:Myb-like domain-containing protein n=1 Tax=Chara braunii TaxID=69332 RepID=A0A388KFF8_CHABU|nr:hypothetical protein CBR_g3334 [Chara braunii]|eukprot:GBG68794.1 hypothetical protein CBR_g3334 [Chara braunii]
MADSASALADERPAAGVSTTHFGADGRQTAAFSSQPRGFPPPQVQGNPSTDSPSRLSLPRSPSPRGLHSLHVHNNRRSDSPIRQRTPPVDVAWESPTSTSVPTGVEEGKEEGACMDAGMGDAWAVDDVDIAATQCGGSATIDKDNEANIPAAQVSESTAHERGGAVPDGGFRGGKSNGKGQQKKSSGDWGFDESLALLRLLFEEDMMQQQRQGRQKMRGRKEKYAWIISKLKQLGIDRGQAECERRYYLLLDHAKRIRDFHGCSGERISWNMSRTERRECFLPLTYEKQYFDALHSKLQKKDGSCEGLMQSVHLQGGGSNANTDDDDNGGGGESGAPRRRVDSDCRDGSKHRHTGGGRGHGRGRSSDSSLEEPLGSSSPFHLQSLVDATDQQAEKLAGELKRLQGELESANMREAVALSIAEETERTVAAPREEVARLQHQLSLYEDGSMHLSADSHIFVSSFQSPGGLRPATVARVHVSIGHAASASPSRAQLHRRLSTSPATARSPHAATLPSPDVNRREVTAVADQLRRVMSMDGQSSQGPGR